MTSLQDVQASMQTIEHLREKTAQVMRIYAVCWEERAAIYSNIIVAGKKGPGLFSHFVLRKNSIDLEKGFAPQLRRLDTINKREQKVLNIIIENRENTFALVEEIVSSLQSIELGGERLFDALGREELEAMQTLKTIQKSTEQYLNKFSSLQLQFLQTEQQFIQKPSLETLQAAYCGLVSLEAKAEGLKDATHAGLANRALLERVQEAGKTLQKSIELQKAIATKERDYVTVTKLEAIKKKIRPYMNENNMQLYGDRKQRLSLLTRTFWKAQASIGIRSLVLAPILLFAADFFFGIPPSAIGKNSVTAYLLLHTLNWVAYVTDIGTYQGGFVIDSITNMFKHIHKKTGTENPFQFICNA